MHILAKQLAAPYTRRSIAAARFTAQTFTGLLRSMPGGSTGLDVLREMALAGGASGGQIPDYRHALTELALRAF